MAPEILHRVIHGRPDPEPWQKALLTVKPAILHGYRRHRVRGADYPGIIPVRNDSSHVESQPGDYVSTGTESQASPASGRVDGSTSSAKVLGTLVSGLTDGDVHRLDIFEGSEYVKVKVRVRVLRESLHDEDTGSDSDKHIRDVLEAAEADIADEEDEEVEAFTYVWVAGTKHLEDAEWDFESFRRDKMAWWVSSDERDW